MNRKPDTTAILRAHGDEIAAEWMEELRKTGSRTDRRIGDGALEAQTRQFVQLLRDGSASGDLDTRGAAWRDMREFLGEVSRTRVAQGFTSDQTATFVFSFKRPLFTRLQREIPDDAGWLAQQTWLATALLDQLGLETVRAYQETREAVIRRQQEDLLELSTPVVELWDGVLALPMIGTLDSGRTQVVMETLLQRILDTRSEIAIIDITGVPTVDTLVAQYLLKTVAAIRLMGADCIISGVRPQIAQTIVHLGVDLADVTTKASLADALALALKRSGFAVTRRANS